MTSLDRIKRLNSDITRTNREISNKQAERKVHMENLQRSVEELQARGFKVDTTDLASIKKSLLSIQRREQKRIDSEAENAEALLSAYQDGDYQKMRSILGVEDSSPEDSDSAEEPSEEQSGEVEAPQERITFPAEGSKPVEADEEEEPYRPAFDDVTSVMEDLDDEDEEEAAPAPAKKSSKSSIVEHAWKAAEPSISKAMSSEEVKSSVASVTKNIWDDDDDEDEIPVAKPQTAAREPAAKKPNAKKPSGEGDVKVKKRSTPAPNLWDDFEDDDDDPTDFSQDLTGTRFNPKNKK